MRMFSPPDHPPYADHSFQQDIARLQQTLIEKRYVHPASALRMITTTIGMNLAFLMVDFVNGFSPSTTVASIMRISWPLCRKKLQVQIYHPANVFLLCPY